MIEIILNGEPREVAPETTVTGLLESLGMAGKRLAIEYNLEILPKSQHAETVLKTQDRVEIVHAIGGG